jgi:hypothetical protein
MPIHLFFSDILLKPQAYLDPGSGSMLVQGLVALLLAGGFFLKVFWRKIFPKKGNKSQGDGLAEHDEVDSDDDAGN